FPSLMAPNLQTLIFKVAGCRGRGKNDVGKYTQTLKVSTQEDYKSLAKASHMATFIFQEVENKILPCAQKKRLQEHL
uniref:Uncharacterized protein n=1 Tax=Prolemur simus TaxID=1328070 RepID=A0A8C9ASF8_PROSS